MSSDGPTYTSKYDPAPWTATAPAAETGAADDGPPQDVDPSSTSVLWGQVPDVDLATAPGGGDAHAARPENKPVVVDVPVLRTMLALMLAGTRDISAQQAEVLRQVQASHDPTSNIWGAHTTKVETVSYKQGFDGMATKDIEYRDEGVQKAAAAFAPSIAAAQDAALNHVSQVLYGMGQFMAGVEKSVDGYAAADAAAKIPDVPAGADGD